MRYALIVEYDGTRYSGFQYQKNAPTIQEEIEKAIARFTGERVRARAAGRTDAGVHATGQVVAFDSQAGHPPEVALRALNSALPPDIAVRAARVAADDFDPRRHATERSYVYTIHRGATRSPLLRRTTCHIGRALDMAAMIEAAALFVGAHDFSRFAGALQRPDASPVREMYGVRVWEDGELTRIEARGNAYLPHQVRRMAGALVDVGLGRLARGDIAALLAGDETAATARALPPQGLCLVRVEYGDSGKV